MFYLYCVALDTVHIRLDCVVRSPRRCKLCSIEYGRPGNSRRMALAAGIAVIGCWSYAGRMASVAISGHTGARAMPRQRLSGMAQDRCAGRPGYDLMKHPCYCSVASITRARMVVLAGTGLDDISVADGAIIGGEGLPPCP